MIAAYDMDTAITVILRRSDIIIALKTAMVKRFISTVQSIKHVN